MSTTIEDLIEQAEQRAALMRLVLQCYPSVKVDRLWDDGPLVPVLSDPSAMSLATTIDVVIYGKRPTFRAFFEILAEDVDPKIKMRVYCMPSETWIGHEGAWYSVLEKLSTDGTAALLDAVRRAG